MCVKRMARAVTENCARRFRIGIVSAASLCFAWGACFPGYATQPHPSKLAAIREPGGKPGQQESHIGDVLTAAPPLANLSPALTTAAIDKAVRTVGNWQLNYSEKYFNREWTFAALYAGYMTAANALPDLRFQTAMLRMGNHHPHAFDQKAGVAAEAALVQGSIPTHGNQPEHLHSRASPAG